MIVAGIGCRKGATAEEVEAAIAAALKQTGCAGEELVLIVLVRPAELEASGARTQSSSPRVMALAVVPSVAEAAALFAGGPKSELIAPRIAVGPVTCALVRTEALP